LLSAADISSNRASYRLSCNLQRRENRNIMIICDIYSINEGGQVFFELFDQQHFIDKLIA